MLVKDFYEIVDNGVYYSREEFIIIEFTMTGMVLNRKASVFYCAYVYY